MAIFAVHYTYHPEKAALRDQHRSAHRQWISEHYEAGNILISGPYPDGTGALFLVRGTDADAAAALVANDPFNEHGALDGVLVLEWTQIYGPFDD